MHSPGAVLFISCYELGHQPLSLASPLGTLRRAGYAAVAVDTSVEELTDASIAAASLVALSVPMHTALRLGIRVAERVRVVNPAAHICFYGLYASLNANYLLRAHADSIIGGEYEEALLGLLRVLELAPQNRLRDVDRDVTNITGITTRARESLPVLERLPFAQPVRDALPGPQQYARFVRGNEMRLTGYVEASRGCLHTCRHCPITPVYGGRFFVVPRNVVLEDIRAQVRAGVQHITFGDPDFLNGPRHSLEIVRALHAEFPDVTFDATIKVEHILERRALFRELGERGCAFVVSAVESLSEQVLRHLAKGHSRDDVVEALHIVHDAGIPLRPTFVTFTPWTTGYDYLELLDFIAEHDLIEHVDPVQYTIRLLVPPGSALLDEDDASSWVGSLDEANFSYRWSHPDPRMDELHRRVSAVVERATRAQPDIATTFSEVYTLASELFGQSSLGCVGAASRGGVRVANRPVPRLSEPWFC
ncbi:MAG: CUAEP/CCAEP-tail radical SAM (seleno)protein [Ktedonobacterales bacterium]